MFDGAPGLLENLDMNARRSCCACTPRGGCTTRSSRTNVLMQRGDITEWPAFREKKDRRFQIKDSGRSVHYPNVAGSSSFLNGRFKEECECRKTFGIHDF